MFTTPLCLVQIQPKWGDNPSWQVELTSFLIQTIFICMPTEAILLNSQFILGKRKEMFELRHFVVVRKSRVFADMFKVITTMMNRN